MSNLNKKILLFVMLVGLTLGLVGCSNPDNSVRIRFAEEEYELRLNETKVIEPTIIKSSQVGDVELAYSSSDETVVKVVDGVLVPVAMGEATVKVEWANRDIIFDKVTVRVIKAALPQAVLNYEAAMLKNDTQTVSVSLANNLTEAAYTINALTPEIATVEGDVITAVAVGEAKFEVVVADYEEEATYEFSVKVEESDFAIKYNLDGGVNHAENPVGYNALELPLALKEPTKLGYTFLGWYHGEEKVEAIPAGTLGDYEVTAKWEIVEYTIAYSGLENATFEAGYELPKAYTVESEEIVFAAPAKVGYKFLGWFAGEEKVEKIAKGSTGNVELVAEWEVIEYAISYETAHGKLPGYTKVEDAIADFLADYNAYAGKEHTVDTFKELGSWGEISTASNFLYSDAYRAKWAWLVDYLAAVGSPANSPAYKAFNNYNSQKELNAANGNYIYQVAYELRGWVGQFKYTKNANYHTSDYSDAAISGAMLDYCGVAVKYTVETADIVLPVLEETGYNFLGWYAGEDKVEVIAQGSTGDVNLVAKWEIIEYTITYTTAHGTLPGYATVGDAIADFLADYNAFAGKSHTVETFKELGSWGEISTASNFLYSEAYRAKWAWLVDYLAAVGSPANSPAYKAFNNYNSQKELNAANGNYIYEIAYELRGWVGQFQYTKNKNYHTSDYSDAAISGAMFDYCGLPKTYTVETADIVLPVLAEEDYVFLGWYIGEELVEKIAQGTTGNLEVVAKWREVYRYSMTWNLEGGAWEEGKEGPAELKEGQFAEFVLPTPVKKYCEFLGWYNAAGEKVEKLEAEQNYELTAKWEDKRINGGTQYILFQLEGGNWKEGQVPGVDVTDYVEVLKLIPVKFGYEFAEWEVQSDNDTDPVTVIYTAKWSEVQVYTITYVLNEGVNAESNPAQYTASSLPIALAPATKEGFKFLGWFDGETQVEAIAAGTTGNLTLEARWESTTLEITFDLAGGEMEGNAPEFAAIAAELLADFNEIGGTSLEAAGFAKGSSSAIKVVMADAGFLTKWAWFFTFAIEDLKAANPEATSAYLLDVYPALEESLKGESAIFTGGNGANARTMIRNYMGGLFLHSKGCPSNTEFQKFATDFSDAARQAALVAAAPQSYTFEYQAGEALPTPTKEGYVFKGWYNAENELVTVATASGTLTAQWEEEVLGPFTISYDLAGGAWGTVAPASHEEIKTLFLADMLAYLQSLGQQVEVIDPVDQPDHLTDFFGISYAQRDNIPAFFTTHEVYSAKWKWMYDYVATVSGADLTNSTILRSNIHGFVYSTTKLGWPVSHDFSAVSFGDYADKVPAALGVAQAGPAEYAYGEALDLPVPVKEGATFAGWTLEGAAFEGITATTKGNLVLVATWE